MSLEIERKYLVVSQEWRSSVIGCHRIQQAYLADTDRISIRVRINDADAAALSLKAEISGTARQEFEYPIAAKDAKDLLRLRTGAIVVKTRHIVRAQNLLWEIDEFEAENAGLVLAEIELEGKNHTFEHPPWLGDEVTSDQRFHNSHLARLPFSLWR